MMDMMDATWDEKQRLAEESIDWEVNIYSWEGM
jgi:hypothetical protein